ncbi:hypothetical protein Csa_021534 [Cucumis sativus]|nr:hypothetical protein Csa_021534 [Cucumis sativus]
MCVSPVKDDCSRRAGHPPENGLGPTDRERIRLWPLGTSPPHKFTGVEHASSIQYSFHLRTVRRTDGSSGPVTPSHLEVASLRASYNIPVLWSRRTDQKIGEARQKESIGGRAIGAAARRKHRRKSHRRSACD